MEKLKKDITEDDILAAILKVKPTEEMPKRKPKKTKAEQKPEK